MTQTNHKKILAVCIPVAMGLALLLGGSLVSTAEEPQSSEQSGVAPAMEGEASPQTPEEPQTGEVQERAVPRMMPGLTKPQLGRAPKLSVPGVAPNPPAFGALPGEFTIRTYLKNTPLSARDGGHHSIDAVFTVPSVIGPYQKFKLASVQPDFTTIQTARGYYVSATWRIWRRVRCLASPTNRTVVAPERHCPIQVGRPQCTRPDDHKNLQRQFSHGLGRRWQSDRCLSYRCHQSGYLGVFLGVEMWRPGIRVHVCYQAHGDRRPRYRCQISHRERRRRPNNPGHDSF